MRRLGWLRPLLLAVALFFVASIVAEGGLLQVSPSVAAPQQVVVMGDSIASGCCVAPEESWASILADRLGVDEVNLGLGGATSHSLMHQARSWPSGRHQSQLDEALSILEESAGNVTAVTLDVGANDWLWLRDPDAGQLCVVNSTPACDELVDAAIQQLEVNLHTILRDIAAATAGGPPVLVLTYYDLWEQPATLDTNRVIERQTREHGLIGVDAHTPFQGRADELLSKDLLHLSAAGHAWLADIVSNAVPPDSDGDGLSDLMEGVLGADPAIADTDGDGCSDGQEFAPAALHGGRRDPTNFWDFFDTPGPSNVRDGGVGFGSDILPVVLRLGATDAGGTAAVNRHTDPLSPVPADPRAYHPAFDRSPGAFGGSLLSLGPPDGTINLFDAMAVIAQYQHRC